MVAFILKDQGIAVKYLTCIGSATPSLVFTASMILGLASQFISSSMTIPDSLVFSMMEIPAPATYQVMRNLHHIFDEAR